jgi:hypothetical protein
VLIKLPNALYNESAGTKFVILYNRKEKKEGERERDRRKKNV